jgi:hypothetical protein
MIEPYDLRKKVEIYFIGALLLLAVIYGGFRAYPLVAGPAITIYSPQDGDQVSSSTFQISGKVSRVNEITIQGRPITIDTEGHFIETLVSHAPYTIIVVVATDQYGATVTKTLRVVPH